MYSTCIYYYCAASYICYCALGILHYTGLATGECANINSSSVYDNNRTMELVNIRERAQDLTMACDDEQNDSNNSTIDMLLSITSETNSVINTTTPLQPIDIPIVLDILRTVLMIRYVYVHTLAS